MRKVIIIGGGLTGISTAFHLEKQGINYHLFEKNFYVGGLCSSVGSNGFTFDYTGHLLHLRNKYSKNLIKSLLKNNIFKIKRNSYIFSKNIYTPYPFQANTFGLPSKVIRECVYGFLNVTQAKRKK